MNIKAFWQLVRPLNLLVIVLTMYLLHYCLIVPLYTWYEYLPALNHFGFFLLVMATVAVAAAGYMINDYFDVQADSVNKPEKLIVDHLLSKDGVLRAYGLLNVLGIGTAFYLAWQIGAWRLGFIHVLAASLLWFYSKSLKRKVLVGNIVVSVLIALCVLLVACFETNLWELIKYNLRYAFKAMFESVTGFNVLDQRMYIEDEALKNLIVGFIGGYALFAFLLNLIREMLKDVEDIAGDEKAGYRTLPVVAGIPFTKLLILVVVLYTIKLLFNFQMDQFINSQYVVVIGVLLLLQLPLIYLVWRLFNAQRKTDFSHISKVVKMIMLAGLLYLPYFAWSISYQDASTNAVPIEEGTMLPNGEQIIGFEVDTIETIIESENLPDENVIQLDAEE